MWIENDMIGNNIVSAHNTLKQVIGCYEKDNKIWNNGNNDYSVSNKLQTKVQAAICSIDIIIDVLFAFEKEHIVDGKKE